MKGEVIMRVQKINESTLRIFLSFSELAERKISMTDLFQRSAQTEQYFCEMLAKAGEEVDFILDGPFWIQAQVVSSDEFIITVLKQDEQADVVEDTKPKAKRRRRNNQWIYRFEDWEQLITLSDSLEDCVPSKNSIYYLDSAYYLVIGSRGITGVLRQKVESLLKEYGDKVNFSKVFLEEHGKVIQAGNALATVKRYFVLQKTVTSSTSGEDGGT
jgi:adapter protein MecA 1/2